MQLLLKEKDFISSSKSIIHLKGIYKAGVVTTMSINSFIVYYICANNENAFKSPYFEGSLRYNKSDTRFLRHPFKYALFLFGVVLLEATIGLDAWSSYVIGSYMSRLFLNESISYLL